MNEIRLDDSFQFQLKNSDGSWSYYSQAEYMSREAALATIAEIYGGAFNEPSKYRIIRHERHIES